MKKSNVQDFTTGNISKQLIAFASPLFLSNLLQVVYNMVDMIVVGNVLGKTGLSAVAIGGDISNFMTFIAMGYANAGQVLIAQLIGSKQNNKIAKFVGTMTTFLLGCALCISVVAIILQNNILQWMKTPSESYAGASSYSLICMIGLVFIYGYNIVSAILRGMGDSKHPFIFISTAAVMNLVLDIIFVAYLNMGAGGAALATVISQAASFIACTVFLYKNRHSLYLDIKKEDFLHLDKEMLSSLIKLGTPMAIKSASIQVSKLFVNSWINSYGVAVSAFAGIANKIASISNLVSNAMNTAGSTMVGQNIAAKKYTRVNEVLIALAKITISVATMMSLAFVFFSKEILSIFTSDLDVLQIGVKYVPIAVLLFFGSALRAIMNALINGSGDYKMNFVTAILDGVVMRIGLAILFGLVLNYQHYGFWLGDALAGFTPFVIGIVFYYKGSWKKGSN